MKQVDHLILIVALWKIIYKIKIIIIKAKLGPFKIDQEEQDLHKLSLHKTTHNKMESIEFNIFKIIMLKKSFKDRQQVKGLKELLHTRHLCPNTNFRNGEKNFGVSKIILE